MSSRRATIGLATIGRSAQVWGLAYKGDWMRLYVGFTAFQSYIDPADVGRLRAKVGEKVQEWQQAGKLEAGGIFAGNRQGFAVLNVASEDEAFELLGDMADFAVVETHPLVAFETLGKFFAEHPVN
jgi:muconolactone delta-isomerase